MLCRVRTLAKCRYYIPLMQRSIRISLKELPGVSRLLASRPLDALTRRFGRQLVTDLLRETLEALRGEVLAGRLEGAELRRAVAPRAIAAHASGALIEPLNLSAAMRMCMGPFGSTVVKGDRDME